MLYQSTVVKFCAFGSASKCSNFQWFYKIVVVYNDMHLFCALYASDFLVKSPTGLSKAGQLPVELLQFQIQAELLHGVSSNRAYEDTESRVLAP